MAVANFFWHGDSLSLYERCCIHSFVINGFDVRVHTFNLDLKIPQGASLYDASQIAKLEDVNKYVQGGKKGCLAAFSDIFRYKLLSLSPGWWFDTDVFCLRPAMDYDLLANESKGITVGYQSKSVINGAIVFIKEASIAERLYDDAQKKGYVLKWGDIGPSLITDFIEINSDVASVLSPECFYPIEFEMVEQTDGIFDSASIDLCKEKTKGAYCIHLWNEAIRRKKIPKNIYPPMGSYLYELFIKTNEIVDPLATMPVETIHALSFLAGIKKSERKVLMNYRSLRAWFMKSKKIFR